MKERLIICHRKARIHIMIDSALSYEKQIKIQLYKTCIFSISIASNFFIGKEKKVPIKGETERRFHFRHHRGMISIQCTTSTTPPYLVSFCVLYVDSTRLEKVSFVSSSHPLSSSIPLSHPFIALVVHEAIIQEKKAVRFLNARLRTLYIIDWYCYFWWY